MLRAVQLGLGEGPINKVGPMSQPRSTIDVASRTLILTRAHMRFLNQLYSMGDLHPHIYRSRVISDPRVPVRLELNCQLLNY